MSQPEVLRKGDVTTLVNSDGRMKRVKVTYELPFCRHYIVRDQRGLEWSLFIDIKGNHWLVPED